MKFEQVDCPKCNSSFSHIVLAGKDYLHQIPGSYSVSECDNCGLWFQNPRPTIDSLAALYPDDYVPHLEAAGECDPSARRAGSIRYLQRSLGYHHLQNGQQSDRFDWRSLKLFDGFRRWNFAVSLLPSFVPGGRLLEIGCGSGGRLRTLKTFGWQNICGIEMVPAAAERARVQGFPVQCGLAEELLSSYSDEHFDVIVSSMVLEHLANPFAFVRQLAAKLKPNGQFLFSTICRDSLDAKMYGKYWAGFDFPRHLVYLAKRDLRDLLSEGFNRVEFFHHPEPIDFFRSSTWRRADGRGRLVDAIISKFGSSPPASMLSNLLARAGLTCRVSIQCRKSPVN